MIGNIIGNRYKIIDRIGQGGMAVIYKAQDLRLKRDVAIKVLQDSMMKDAEVLSRFIREAQSAAKLMHPNIINVFDIEEFSGINYIIMELVEGQSLKELIDDKAPLDFGIIRQVFRQICEAVKYAHENGIIHRDLKPQNVLLSDDFFVKVTDFGIARALTSSSLTQTGAMMGSVQYFSPEQAQGKPVDKATDVYSLGIILYECLTGVLPFTGDNPVTVALKQVQDEPPIPSRINPKVNKSLDNVVKIALMKEQDRRFEDADEFFDALDKALISDDSQVKNETFNLYPSREGETLIMHKKSLKNGGLTNNSEEDEEDEEGFHKRYSSGGNFIYVAILLIFLVIVTGFFIERGLLFRTKDIVPDMEGFTLEKARKLADKKGWQISIGEESFSNSIPEGVIISQTPKKGASLPRGGIVKVVISKGKPKIEVPDLTGMSKERALQELSNLGLKGSIEKKVYSDRYETDVVVAQSPLSQELISPGRVVLLVISKGSQKIEVPNLVGKKREEGMKILKDKGLKLIISDWKISDKYPDGSIISQKPVAGGMVERKSGVEVVIAKGLDNVKTPDLTGKTIREARNFLVTMGINLKVDENVTDENQLIQGQEPLAGASLPSNRTIKVWGPQLVLVPELTGKTLEEAQNIIDRNGLAVGEIKYTKKFQAVPGTVLEQNPKAGIEVDKGSRVTITVASKSSTSDAAPIKTSP